ncbi:uncharacterized protein LOC129885688 [Solanum dulcamara]|uniref:uncharacterized protein LOC129885688 n=1 Tax=Solanum dulcamara TaxID=45834 RepID=UPI002485A1F1|nr:uncharacterized protein LOC129885688 [Solanum dulcamara]
MDALIGCLQTHELNRAQDGLKKETKQEKTLALKVASSELSVEDEDMVYLTMRFHKIVRKNGGFVKKSNSSRLANATDLYHKYGKPGHFIRDCPMHKVEYKEYVRNRAEKRRDLIPDKKGRKAETDYVVKKAFAVWGNSSSDSEESTHLEDASMVAVKDDEEVFDSLFAFMAQLDDEEADDDDETKVTLANLRQNLHIYSAKKLRSLAAVVIDSVTELINEKDMMNNTIDIFQDEKLVLVSRITDLEEQIMVLISNNVEP